MERASVKAIARRVAAGALIAVGGAFVWALIAFSYWFMRGHNPGETILQVIPYAGYAVLVASWFVLPLGALVGVVMPRFIVSCSPRAAFSRGALLGLFVAIVAAVLTSVLLEWTAITGHSTIVDHDAWRRSVIAEFLFNLGSMSIVCALWVGAWAMRWSRRRSTA